LLKSIHISHLQLHELGASDGDSEVKRLYVGWVPEFLASVFSDIDQVQLSIWISTPSDIDILDWPCVKGIFKRPQFAKLRELLLNISGKIYNDADKELVERRIYTGLNGCRAADVLEFRWH
jgi:hypothetical protein